MKVLRFVIHSTVLFESHLLMTKVGLYTAKRVQTPNRPKAWRGWAKIALKHSKDV